MQILRKHVTRWRVKFRPQPSGSPFCALFVRSTNFSCENAGAHIKHVVIPLNLASGINRRYSHGWPSSATGIKIKFFNKMKLLPLLVVELFRSRAYFVPMNRRTVPFHKNENAKKNGKVLEKCATQSRNKCEKDLSFFTTEMFLVSTAPPLCRYHHSCKSDCKKSAALAR